MNDWIRVSKSAPCQICGKPDWCGYSLTHAICLRISSDRPTANGGWLHPLGSAPDIRFAPKRKAEPVVDCAALMRQWWIEGPPRIIELSEVLQVDSHSLMMMNATWAERHQAWAFPMVNSEREITGIRLRNEHGEKWAVKGGRNGLFVPSVQPQKRVFIVEGPTDCAALLSIGLFAIGRPSCNEGADIFRALLPKLGVRSAVIVSDHDDDKARPDGSTYNPGVDGAVRLSERLPVPNCIWLPPTKDAREFVKHGGTAQQIEAMIRGVKWKQPEERR